MNFQQIIAAIAGTIALLTTAGSAILWAGDDRYMLREESKQMIVDNQCQQAEKELEWLETLAQNKALTIEQKLKRDWLERQIEKECK
jgi:hypothetical protein